MESKNLDKRNSEVHRECNFAKDHSPCTTVYMNHSVDSYNYLPFSQVDCQTLLALIHKQPYDGNVHQATNISTNLNSLSSSSSSNISSVKKLINIMLMHQHIYSKT